MDYSSVSVSERRFLPPAVAVSTVAFALRPPPGAHLGDTQTGDRAGGDAAVGEPRVPGVPNTEAPDSETLISDAVLWIPLVRRTRPPFAGCWALPGGSIPWDETLVDTALRTLRAAALRDPGYLEQLYSFGSIERSADAQRLVTISYWALYGEDELAAPAADTAAPDSNVAWFPADRLPELAFDHAEIVDYALWRLRLKTEYQAVAHRFLGPTFTIAQLRAVREAILGEPVDPANFRRQVLAQGRLIDTGHTQTGGRHRPARLYRFADEPDPAPAPAMT